MVTETVRKNSSNKRFITETMCLFVLVLCAKSYMHTLSHLKLNSSSVHPLKSTAQLLRLLQLLITFAVNMKVLRKLPQENQLTMLGRLLITSGALSAYNMFQYGTKDGFYVSLIETFEAGIDHITDIGRAQFTNVELRPSERLHRFFSEVANEFTGLQKDQKLPMGTNRLS